MRRCRARRHPGLARALLRARLRRGGRRGRRGAGAAGARSTCASTRSRPTATRCSRRWPASRRRRRRCSPIGVRLPAPDGAGRQPNVEAEVGHGTRLVRGAGRGLAARGAAGQRRARASRCSIFVQAPAARRWPSPPAMRNTGQIYAYDEDALRLRPIFERLKRAGVRNAQVLPAGDQAALRALGRPLRSRLRRCALHRQRRLATSAGRQMAAAAGELWPSAKPSSARCSWPPPASSSLAAGSSTSPARCCRRRMATRAPGFWRTIRFRCVAVARGVGRAASAASRRSRPMAAIDHLLLTPARHGTDGFFIAGCRRQALSVAAARRSTKRACTEHRIVHR